MERKLKTLDVLNAISESLELKPEDVVKVSGQHISKHGLVVYPVRVKNKTLYVTIPDKE
jgi:hypothetical protein